MTVDEGPDSFPRLLREWARALLIVIVVWLVIRTFLVEAYRIPSGSMANTLLEGDLLFVDKAAFGARVPLVGWRMPPLRAPHREDLVVFESVEQPGHLVVKRIVGLPGDTLEMRMAALYRDGVPVDEPYARNTEPERSESLEQRLKMRAWQLPAMVGPDTAEYDPDLDHWGPIVVPPDSLFVLGDNRDNSYDGRYWGWLPRANLRGTPLLIYYSYDPTSYRRLPFLTAVRTERLFTIPR